MGISIASSQGTDGKSVVSASACLDKGCMMMAQDSRIQTKSELISPEILTALTKVRVLFRILEKYSPMLGTVTCFLNTYSIYDCIQSLLIQYRSYHQGVVPKRVLIYR